ncbi:phosphotransferase [Streptomyces sp. PSKA54]|uniref:Phosphotransferase n=1 Tax=Streptomyces himalayensis subsp. aureolus TaxID=2758039 RepID=A0A7W2D905_9ACTN|nr:phosphotransferase [Streptomyces himalayensis subsp. aureolus]
MVVRVTDVNSGDLGGVASVLPALVRAFGLSEATSWTFLTTGLMNRNWRLETHEGTFALKEISDVSLAKARRNLGVLSRLADERLPVCEPVHSVSGDPVVEVEGRGYCLLPWVDGKHVRGTELSLDEVRKLGGLLARLHEGLNGAVVRDGLLPRADERPRARVTTPEAAATNADRLLQTIGRSGSEAFDRFAAEALEQRKLLLDKYAPLRPSTEVPLGFFGWTHGDFQYRNILRRDGTVVAVLDWDRIQVRPYGEEVARTAQVQFGMDGRLDLERVAAFVTGYRAVVPLGVKDLADAVSRLWWKRLTDFWQLEWHYDRQNSSCDDLFLADEPVVQWWSEHLDEVRAAFAACP